MLRSFFDRNSAANGPIYFE